MKPTTTLFALAGLALGATAANAAISASATGSTLDASGTVIYAVNAGISDGGVNGSSTGTTVVQGITFVNVATSGNHVTNVNPTPYSASTNPYLDLGGYAGYGTGSVWLSSDGDMGTYSNADNVAAHYGTATVGTVSGDADEQDLWGTTIYTSGNEADYIDLYIAGLDAGKTYMVQVLLGEGRSGSWANWEYDISVDGVDTGVDLATAGSSFPGIPTIGTVRIEGMTGATNYTITMGRPGEFPAISGLVVSEVIPEPSTAILGSLGLLGLLRRRRK